MAIYLAKYRPLIARGNLGQGQEAVDPPFVDGSCRREPDFQSVYPSISAVCRGPLFAPRLQVGDEVVYITVKGFYGQASKHWRVVARLKVIKRWESHTDAAAWYRDQRLPLPSNCLVPDNPPIPLPRTSRSGFACYKDCSDSESVAKWDAKYQLRIEKNGVFLACETIWMDYETPAILTEVQFLKVIREEKKMNSRSPILLTPAQVAALEVIALKSRI